MRLRLGPMLRRVTPTTATIWVETEAPGTVTVVAGDGAGAARASAATFTVHGHHYAVLDLVDLAPGAALAYRVLLDSAQVWPPPDSEFPASLVRTPAPGAAHRVVFGSCRRRAGHDAAGRAERGVDALRAHARRLARVRADRGAGSEAEPSLLLLIGDQVYADELYPEMVDFLRRHRAAERGGGHAADPPADEVVSFAEYAELYRQSWDDPAVRWLLSTVPTLMVFDDHDIRDDWNTSGTWRQEMAGNPWWPARITAGLGAYWVYQHAGNLAAEQRESDPVWKAVTGTADGTGADAGPLVDQVAWKAHEEPGSYSWSFRYDLDGVRVVALDTRCGRQVADDRDRAMLSGADAAWLRRVMTEPADHLLVASSLPVLLPHAVHYLQAWNEQVCAGRWGGLLRGLGERLRQEVDLEHWAAFHGSFESLTATACELAAGEHGAAPASVLFLGGDVHFSYLARAELPAAAGGPGSGTVVAQVVSSPIRNPLSATMRLATRFAATPPAGWVARGLARLAGVRAPRLRWRLAGAPRYDNTLATLGFDGRGAEVWWETPGPAESETLHETGRQRLNGP